MIQRSPLDLLKQNLYIMHDNRCPKAASANPAKSLISLMSLIMCIKCLDVTLKK